MDKFDHKILMRKILKNKTIKCPLSISLGTFREPLKYNRMGEPIADELWEVLIRENEYFQVAMDELDDLTIFTVWTGINFCMKNNDENKYIFQTVFMKDNNPLNFTSYYITDEIAFKNHQKLVFLADQKILYDYMEN